MINFFLSLAVLFGFFALDIMTTDRVLKRGGGEMNKLVRFFIRKFGTVRGMILNKALGLGLLGAAMAVTKAPVEIAAMVVQLSSILFAIVVANNINVLGDLK